MIDEEKVNRDDKKYEAFYKTKKFEEELEALKPQNDEKLAQLNQSAEHQRSV